MTRNLLSILMALPLTFVVVGCDPIDDDDTSGDDDTDVTTELHLKLNVDVVSPNGVVDKCVLDRDMDTELENVDGCSESLTITKRYEEMEIYAGLTSEHMLFAPYTITVMWTSDGVDLEVDGPGHTEQIEEDEDGNITVNLALEWSNDGAWGAAPSGPYDCSEPGCYEHDIESFMQNGVLMIDGVIWQEAVVTGFDFSASWDGNELTGWISEDLGTIYYHAIGSNGTEEEMTLFRQ